MPESTLPIEPDHQMAPASPADPFSSPSGQPTDALPPLTGPVSGPPSDRWSDRSPDSRSGAPNPPGAPFPSPAAPPTTNAPPARRGLRGQFVPVVVASVLSAALAAGVTVALDDDPAPTSNPAPITATSDGGAADVVPVSDPTAVAAARIAPAVVQISTTSGVGSGVVYDADGLILTVAHVVGQSRTVSVRLADGTTVDGTVVGTHSETDVAVVSIDPSAVQGVAVLALADRPTVGEVAVAVGSPRGFDQTVTAGIVSAVDRVVNRVAMVQTDAAVNPGNSGGPLVDGQGRVLGLNDIIFTESGGSEGIGFAVAVDLAKLVADQLVAGQPVQLAVLGVSTTPAADGGPGAEVAQVSPGSAATAAGIETGDVIVALEGEPLVDGGQLRARIVSLPAGSPVTIGVVRDGGHLDLEVVLGAST